VSEASTAAHEGDGISFPSGLVEIDSQKAAGSVEQHWIRQRRMVITGVSPRHMPSDDIVGHREKADADTPRT
jgi:hypothetical protein